MKRMRVLCVCVLAVIGCKDEGSDASTDTTPVDTGADTEADTEADTTAVDTTSADAEADTTPTDTTPADTSSAVTYACGATETCAEGAACALTGSQGCTGPPPDPDTGQCAPDCGSSRCGPGGPICLCTTATCVALAPGCEDCACAAASAPDVGCTCQIEDGQIEDGHVRFDCPNTTPLPSCAEIEAEWEALVTGDAQRCGPAECHVLHGWCSLGLGGCYLGVHTGVFRGQLDSVAATWKAAGCDAGEPVCDCPDTPGVRCDAGGCLLTAPQD